MVVLSRDAAIPRLRRALVGPCTTTIRGIPAEVVESVSVGTLVERLGRLGDDRMHQICEALDVAVDCHD